MARKKKPRRITVGQLLRNTRKAMKLSQTNFGILVGAVTGTLLSQDQVSRLENDQAKLLFPKAVFAVLNAELQSRGQLAAVDPAQLRRARHGR